jgi:Fe-S cluster biogenesis protein NfuA
MTDHALPAEASMSVVEKIEESLDVIRPALREDGGDVELVGFDDGVVQLRLVGACSACPISTMTVKQGIERRLKSAVPEIREVQAV